MTRWQGTKVTRWQGDKVTRWQGEYEDTTTVTETPSANNSLWCTFLSPSGDLGIGLVSTHQMLQEDQFDRACQVLLAEVLLRGYWGRFERRAGRARLDKKSNGRETKSWVGGNKNPTKRKVFRGFAEYENLTFLELLYVLHDKSCETQWQRHYRQVMEGTKGLSYQKYSVFCTKRTISQKNNLFWNRF